MFQSPSLQSSRRIFDSWRSTIVRLLDRSGPSTICSSLVALCLRCHTRSWRPTDVFPRRTMFLKRAYISGAAALKDGSCKNVFHLAKMRFVTEFGFALGAASSGGRRALLPRGLETVTVHCVDSKRTQFYVQELVTREYDNVNMAHTVIPALCQ